MTLIKRLLEEDDNDSILKRLNKAYEEGDMESAKKLAIELANALSHRSANLAVDAVADAFRSIAKSVEIQGMEVVAELESNTKLRWEFLPVSDEDHAMARSAVDMVRREMNNRGITFRCYNISSLYHWGEDDKPVVQVYINSIRQRG